jgi:2-methylisocitrate lyase-like PEP mutase family enzyme
MHPGTRLRALLERPEIVVLPGVHDPLTARLAALQGFEAIMAGGNAATGTLLAAPDMGQMGMSDYADHYARVVAAAGLPVLVDADTGFGGVHNVTQTIRAFERAGAAGLFMEDQVTPKRCGYIAGKAVVPVAEQVGKLKAALDARTNAEFVICARTDALSVEGVEAAIERVTRYKDTGVDMVFVQGADNLESMRHVVRAVPGWHLANISQAAGSAGLTIAEAEEAGAAAVMFSIATMLTAAAAVERLLMTLKRDRSLDAVKSELMPMSHYNEVVGLDRLQAAEERYTA